MKQFKFFLQKFNNKRSFLKQEIIVEAINLDNARKFVYENYPNWDVSMFWLIWNN